MSIEIDELSKILYDPNGPSKIGIELEVHDEHDNISSSAVSDLYEFLLNILINGIHILGLLPDETNIENIETQLQYYFNRINIHICFERIADIDIDIESYCKIYFTQENDVSKLNVVRTRVVNSTYKSLDEIHSIYILPPSNNKKRKSDTTAIKIKFSIKI